MPTVEEMGMNLRIWPDPILKKRCDEVIEFDKEVGDIVIGMMQVMTALEGLGLSANQVGISKRVVTWKTDEAEGYWINPRITERSEEIEIMMEGCLSFPQIFLPVQRHKEVTVIYEDIDGISHEVEYVGALAHTAQHEIDHLDGLVFIRGLSRLKQDMVLRKMKKFNKKVGRIRNKYEQRKKELGTTGLEDTAAKIRGDRPPTTKSEYDFSIDAESV